MFFIWLALFNCHLRAEVRSASIKRCLWQRTLIHALHNHLSLQMKCLQARTLCIPYSLLNTLHLFMLSIISPSVVYTSGARLHTGDYLLSSYFIYGGFQLLIRRPWSCECISDCKSYNSQSTRVIWKEKNLYNYSMIYNQENSLHIIRRRQISLFLIFFGFSFKRAS